MDITKLKPIFRVFSLYENADYNFAFGEVLNVIGYFKHEGVLIFIFEEKDLAVNAKKFIRLCDDKELDLALSF